ncbi:MAG: hypothetical protein ACYTE6_13955 [Planctomycetota bacterium]|jgi:hypothetical protein
MSIKTAVATGVVVTALVSGAAMAEYARPTFASREITINSQIELYTCQQGKVPWQPGEVARTQWRPLVDNPLGDYGYLQSSPSNPLSPPEVATRIVELTEAGDRGLDLDPAHAGWAWNSADHRCYMVGLEQWLAEGKSPYCDGGGEASSPFMPVLILGGASAAVLMLFFAGRLLLSAGGIGAGVRPQSEARAGSAAILSPWAAPSFWCGVLAVFMVTGPLSLVVGTIAFHDVTRNRRRGFDRALFGVVMGLLCTALLAGLLIECWPPNV